MAKVSVIIPSYNLEKYIGEAIESVLAQSFEDLELLITDDASSDNSVELIREYERKDSRVKLFVFEKNQGACAAFNYAVKQAQGKYICYLGADDIFLKNKIEKQVEFLESNKQYAAAFGWPIMIDELGRVIPENKSIYKELFLQENRTRHEWLRRFFYDGNCLAYPSMMVRKEIYEDVGYLDIRFFGLLDLDFWVRMCSKYEIYVMQEYLYKNRLRGKENASAPNPGANTRHTLEYIQVLKTYLNLKKEDLLLVFPEAREKFFEIKDEYSAYIALQMSLLSENNLLHKLFAYECFFDLLKNPSFLKEIETQYDFSLNDFYQIPQKNDFFGYSQITNLTKILPNGSLVRRIAKRIYYFITGKKKK